MRRCQGVEITRDLVLLVAAVVATAALARRLGRTAPLLLVAAGVVAALLPGIEDVRVAPEVILVGVLPPLLYAAAVQTSLVDFRAEVRPIVFLSVGLVAVTMVCTGLVTYWVLPVTLPAALALGAVIAPPDAVAATAIAKKVGMPRRIVTILEGESLVNDATAIVCLHTAVAAITGTVTAGGVAGDLALSVLGGLAVGAACGVALIWLRRHIDDVVTDTTVSLLSPFAVYLVAEEVHASGVLAVVIAGLLLGHYSYEYQSAPSRMMERGNWTTIQFVLENAVFFLIGLQAETIAHDLSTSALSGPTIAVAAAAVLAAVIVVRFAGVFAASYLPPWLMPSIRRRQPAPPAREVTVISWAGMRGAVTLAAVLVLPPETPHREVLVMIALVVAAGTLAVQGSTLPLLVRRLGLRGPDPAQDLLVRARVQHDASMAGIARLEAELTGEEPEELVERLRQHSLERSNRTWEALGGGEVTPSQTYARLRTHMLEAERASVLAARDTGRAPDDVLRQVLRTLDVEEAILVRVAGTDSSIREDDLVAEPGHVSDCDHLAAAVGAHPAPSTPEGCEECLRDGTRWVHLRMCLTCGHVGCCDSSVGRHATAHFHVTGHPVMRSFEPGEAWRWCYIDEMLG